MRLQGLATRCLMAAVILLYGFMFLLALAVGAHLG